MHERRTHNNRQFRLVSYPSLGAGWIPAARIGESTEGTETITPIYGDAIKPFASEADANKAALAMAIEWINSNSEAEGNKATLAMAIRYARSSGAEIASLISNADHRPVARS